MACYKHKYNVFFVNSELPRHMWWSLRVWNQPNRSR